MTVNKGGSLYDCLYFYICLKSFPIKKKKKQKGSLKINSYIHIRSPTYETYAS